MTETMQQRKCEICGTFFFVSLITDDRRVKRVRTAGPWTCDRVHVDPGPGRRLERVAGIGNVMERGRRVRA